MRGVSRGLPPLRGLALWSLSLATWLFIWLGGAAQAVAFSLAPTVLDIDPDRRMTAETRLVNVERVPLTFTAEVMKWENIDGQDVYTPTRDVLVNPTRFTLAPFGKQVIRVGLQKRVGARELTYRLFLRQQPGSQLPATQSPDVQASAAPTSTAQSGEPSSSAATLSTLLNISLPIYAAPASSAPELVYTPQVQGSDLQLTVRNTGTRHFTFRQFSIESDTGQTFKLTSQAVLAGSSATWLLPRFAGARLLKMTTYDAQGQALYDELRLP